MPYSVLVALGSNLGDRALSLRRAIDALRKIISVVRVSPFIDTDPVDAPSGSPRFLNAVVAGYTDLDPQSLLSALLSMEARLGRHRTTRNAPRIIDLDLILHSAHLVSTPALTLPHPRYLGREFVREPLRTLGLSWRDPVTGKSLEAT
ncbi:MAG TPA: 2-amino-4-hydroxy-6-hydroxymethyldihydropteridine diphosphokinase [Thermoanaerobaculia bacterium]|jgi:2-amino-4-hydroxy-6-hydroxymethyldihydropteridine diphosphokinase|nr:2-amino-4-hydroxy-6-hydroxymethyldihydropteridine diphosphokinase [Thermoanaerobaculia bacterium]